MKITEWTRQDHPDIDPNLSKRSKAELETFRDLQKDIQQLLCDSHEEAIAGDATGVLKRMNSLLTIIAWESRRTTNWTIGLSILITILTIFLSVVSVIQLVRTAPQNQEQVIQNPSEN